MGPDDGSNVVDHRLRVHGIANLRGIAHVPCSAHHNPGRFGRLFPALPALSIDIATMQALARSMREDDTPAGDSTTPAGFTFLGQFIDHDITLDTTSSLDRQSQRQKRKSGGSHGRP